MAQRPDTLRGPARRWSLTRRYLVIVIVAELLFGGFVATLIAAYSMQQAAEDHRQSRRALTATVGASLVGELRAQDVAGMRAAIDALVSERGLADIVAASVTAPGGAELYRAGWWPDDAVDDADTEPFVEVIRPSTVHADIVDRGHVLGRLHIVFLPVGLGRVLAFPLVVILAIVVVAVGFSSAWATITMRRTVALPVARLRDAAAAIAAGERHEPLPVSRDDELGELARGLDDMMVQLSERERELTASYRSLEHAYMEQAGLKDDLEAALRTRSDFFAVGSHELRSPLAVVRMYAEMLDEGQLGRLTKAQREAVSSIANAAERLTAIVADLMDVALLDRGLMTLSFSEVDVAALVGNAARDAGRPERGASGAVEVDGPLPRVVVRADEVRLRQVVDNLIDNALKYSAGAGPVRVALRECGDGFEIRVADVGPGIAEDDRDLLFELFRRVETGDDASASGLGLGLAISRRIVRAHGGDIRLESNAGAGTGTVFIVSLPYHGDERERDAARISVV